MPKGIKHSFYKGVTIEVMNESTHLKAIEERVSKLNKLLQLLIKNRSEGKR
jgi:hypothetical protein